MRIIDIANPSQPQELGNCDSPGCSWDIAADGSYAYVADGYEGLRIVDISNPSMPMEVGRLVPGGYARGVAVIGDFAYVAACDSGLRIIDVSDKEAPREMGAFSDGFNATDVAVRDGLAYLPGSGGLSVVDVTSPFAPVLIGEIPLPGIVRCAALGNGVAFVTHATRGVLAVDVSDPSNPRDAGAYQTGSDAQGIRADDDFVYVADGDDGLYVLQHGATRGDVFLPLPGLTSVEVSPNPFPHRTLIQFSLAAQSEVSAAIYDLAGRMVESLARGWFSPGVHTLEWQSGRRSSGSYVLRVTTSDGAAVTRTLIPIGE
jgi:hypothetical protein